MVIIISDFLYPTQQIQNALMRFKDHDIYLIQVLDEQELNLTMEGDFKLVDGDQNQHEDIHHSIPAKDLPRSA